MYYSFFQIYVLIAGSNFVHGSTEVTGFTSKATGMVSFILLERVMLLKK